MSRLLVTGCSGFVGSNVAWRSLDSWEIFGTYSSSTPKSGWVNWVHLDLKDESSVFELIAKVHPDAVIHCAAISKIDYAEENTEETWAVNVLGSEALAEACSKYGARLVALSTDTVFDGNSGWYSEDDPPNPINFYGETKVVCETAIRDTCPDAAIVRTAIVYGFPRAGGATFFAKLVESLRHGQKVELLKQEIRTPVDVITLADALLELASTDFPGLIHIAGTEKLSRFEFGLKTARKLGVDESLVVEQDIRSLTWRAPRPEDISLKIERAGKLLKTRMLDCDAGIERVLRYEPSSDMANET